MKWVTRRNARVNRVATAWLVRRFVDPRPEFLFVEADQVAEIQERDGGLTVLKVDTLLCKLRSDPRFHALLERINLPAG